MDGRRVYLPSYEQATANNDSPRWCDFYQQVTPSSNQLEGSGAVTRPPQSNNLGFTASSPPRPSSTDETSSPNPSTQRQGGEFIGSEQLTVVEFLRELPSTSTGITGELSGFEDNFVPIYPGSRHSVVPDSPTSSLSSNEATNAPLLSENSRQCSEAKAKSLTITANRSQGKAPTSFGSLQPSSDLYDVTRDVEMLASSEEVENCAVISVEPTRRDPSPLFDGNGEVALGKFM